MKEISDLMEKYRESMRHLWNIYFRDMPDGWHEFIDVNIALFQGLVLTHIGDNFGHNKVYESIKIVPSIPPAGTLKIIYLPNEATSGKWQIEKISDADGEYRFIEFFDWRNEKDMMDNNRVVTQAYHVPGNKKLENNRVMFKFSDVKFYKNE